MIFCSGACSHLDTWDYKPELIKRHDTPLPGSDKLVTFQGKSGNLVRSPWQFKLAARAASTSPICCRSWPSWPTKCVSSIR